MAAPARQRARGPAGPGVPAGRLSGHRQPPGPAREQASGSDQTRGYPHGERSTRPGDIRTEATGNGHQTGAHQGNANGYRGNGHRAPYDPRDDYRRLTALPSPPLTEQTGVMPEGDVVWYTARRLHEALAGRTLTRSDFRVPRLATADLASDVVTETASRGKHLLTRTGNGLTVHTHLRMDGTWRVRPAAERFRDSHRIRLLLANEEWQAIGYQLGVVELIRTSEESRGHRAPGSRPPRAGLGPPPRRCARLAPHRTGPSARPCSTSGTWPASGPGSWPRCCSCGASTRGGRPARSRTWTPWSSWDTGCSRRIRRGRGTPRPGTPGPGRRTGSTGGQGRNVPPLRDRDQARRAGTAGAGTAPVLVPGMSEIGDRRGFLRPRMHPSGTVTGMQVPG